MPGLRIAKAIAQSEKILQRGNGIKQLLGASWQVLQLCACKFTTTIFGNLYHKIYDVEKNCFKNKSRKI